MLSHKCIQKGMCKAECGLSLLNYLNVLYSPYHLKESLYDFSLSYLNYQHQYTFDLGTLLSQIKVTWTKALWYLDSWYVNLDTTKWLNWVWGWWYRVVGSDSMGMWDKSMICVLGTLKWDGVRFYHTTRNGMHFKTYELFGSGMFLLTFLDCGWLQETKTVESKTR